MTKVKIELDIVHLLQLGEQSYRISWNRHIFPVLDFVVGQQPPTTLRTRLTRLTGGFVRDCVVVAAKPAQDITLHRLTPGGFCFFEFGLGMCSVILVLPEL